MEGTDEVSNDAVPVGDVYSNSLCHTQSAENGAEKQNKPFISVIMPVYGLSKLVTHSIRAVEKVLNVNGYSYEIIVVDDDSPNDTYRHTLTASGNFAVRDVCDRIVYGLCLGVLNDGEYSGSCC